MHHCKVASSVLWEFRNPVSHMTVSYIIIEKFAVDNPQ